MSDLRKQENRAQRAKLLLENDLLQDAFKTIRKDLLETWETTHPNDEKRREDAYRQIKLLKRLEEILELHITTGKYAEKKLARLHESKLRNIINV